MKRLNPWEKKKIRSLLRRASAGARAPLLHPAYYTALSRSPGRALLTGRCVWGGKGEEMGGGGCRPAMGLFVCVGVLGLGLCTFFGSALWLCARAGRAFRLLSPANFLIWLLPRRSTPELPQVWGIL